MKESRRWFMRSEDIACFRERAARAAEAEVFRCGLCSLQWEATPGPSVFYDAGDVPVCEDCWSKHGTALEECVDLRRGWEGRA